MITGGRSFKGTREGWWAPPGALQYGSPLSGGTACLLEDGEKGVAIVRSGGVRSCVSGDTASMGAAVNDGAGLFFECISLKGLNPGRCLGPELRESFSPQCSEGHTGS